MAATDADLATEDDDQHGFGLHVCLLDSQCREMWNLGVHEHWWDRIPTRVHLSTPWLQLDLALLRGDWFCGRHNGPARPWSLHVR